ncbi:MAG: hypothetical protein GQ527_08395 [Bacteroidales bacterium]|nr:hypothetical protein [Bacteroidales bacterium]
MILTLFKKTYFIQISWVIIFAIILAVPGLFSKDFLFLPNKTLFLQISCIYPWLKINWVYQIISNILLVVLAFYVKSIFSEHQLVHRQNLLPSLLILALFHFIYPTDYLLITVVNLFLIAFSFGFLLKSFDDIKPDNSIFSAAILISIASFISYSNLIFFLLIWMSFIIFQNYNWRYFFITIIGLIGPYLFLFTWLFWFDKTDLISIEWNQFYHQFYSIPSINGLLNIIIFSILTFFVFTSLAKIIPETPSKIIAIRRKTSLSIWFVILSIYPFLLYNDKISNSLIIIPLAGLLGYYLRIVKSRRLWIDILFSIFIALIIFSKYYLIYASEILL